MGGSSVGPVPVLRPDPAVDVAGSSAKASGVELDGAPLAVWIDAVGHPALELLEQRSLWEEEPPSGDADLEDHARFRWTTSSAHGERFQDVRSASASAGIWPKAQWVV